MEYNWILCTYNLYNDVVVNVHIYIHTCKNTHTESRDCASTCLYWRKHRLPLIFKKQQSTSLFLSHSPKLNLMVTCKYPVDWTNTMVLQHKESVMLKNHRTCVYIYVYTHKSSEIRTIYLFLQMCMHICIHVKQTLSSQLSASGILVTSQSKQAQTIYKNWLGACT
jgi:hypothetical protein